MSGLVTETGGGSFSGGLRPRGAGLRPLEVAVASLRLEISMEPDLEFGSGAYAALFARSGASAFQHPLWLEALYGTLAPTQNAEPVVVTARRPDTAELVMALPLLRRRKRCFTTIGYADLGVSDYNVPVCDPVDWAELCADPAASERVRRACGRFDLLRIPKLRPDGPDLAALLGPNTRVGPHALAYAAPLAAPYPQWRETRMSASLRKELDKKRRKLNRQSDLKFERLREPSAIMAALRSLHVFRRPRFELRQEQDVLDNPAVLAFYGQIGRNGAQSGFARTYALTIDGQLAAVTFGISHRGRFLVLLSAFDPALSKLSLGYLLFEDVIRDCIDAQDTVFDLTIGDEAYKTSLGTEETQLSVLTLSGSPIGWAAQRSLEVPAVQQLIRRVRRR